MAGSKRWFNYTLDDGTNVGIQADESNVEAVNGGASNDPPALTAPTRQAPKGTKLRTVYYANTAGTRTIAIPVLNQTIYNGIPANFRTIPDPLGGATPGTLTFVRKRPEISKVPKFSVDTGLTDGDSPG